MDMDNPVWLISWDQKVLRILCFQEDLQIFKIIPLRSDHNILPSPHNILDFLSPIHVREWDSFIHLYSLCLECWWIQIQVLQLYDMYMNIYMHVYQFKRQDKWVSHTEGMLLLYGWVIYMYCFVLKKDGRD